MRPARGYIHMSDSISTATTTPLHSHIISTTNAGSSSSSSSTHLTPQLSQIVVIQSTLQLCGINVTRAVIKNQIEAVTAMNEDLSVIDLISKVVFILESNAYNATGVH